jgi:hypothetical protein
MKRHKNPKPISQKPKDEKRIYAEDAGALEQWYNSLARVTRNIPPRFVYNFDEIGFQPGRGKAQNIISGTYRTVF